jgi:predicted ferric reductase
MKNTKNLGYIFIILIIILTLLIWIIEKSIYKDTFSSPFKYLAKICSISATVLMSFSILLSIKEGIIGKFVENLFQGLDKVYRAHGQIGKIAFLFITLHPIFLAVSTGALQQFLNYSLSFSDNGWEQSYKIGHFIGILSYLILIILIGLTVWKKIPYHIWKYTHQLFAPLFIIFIVHIILVDADIAKYPVLKIWFYTITLFPITIYSYQKFKNLCKNIIKRNGQSQNNCQYRISHIENGIDQVKITLETKEKQQFEPGQFAFFTFPKISKEEHPFSIASNLTDKKKIIVGIKALGEYTTKLVETVALGDTVKVSNGYGKLGNAIMSLSPKSPLVLIGAGVGITPILNIWQSQLTTNTKIYCYYISPNLESAIFNSNFQETNINLIDKNYELYNDEAVKGVKNFFSFEYLRTKKIKNLKEGNFVLCGPEKMINNLTKSLLEYGIGNNQIFIEDFTFKN